MILNDYNGKVPDSLDDMLKLPGVGRKTANLCAWRLFWNTWHRCNTHAKRLSKRIGLTQYDDPEKIEYDLMKMVPRTGGDYSAISLYYMEDKFAAPENQNVADAPSSNFAISHESRRRKYIIVELYYAIIDVRTSKM